MSSNTHAPRAPARPSSLRRRRCLAGALAWVLLRGAGARAADAGLVIVAAAASKIHAIAPADVRKLFLGVPLVVNGVEAVPVRNLSDTQLQEMFLQKVLFMSAQVYERRMLAKLYRDGGNRIAEFDTRDELVRALLDDPRRVTYMRRSAVGPSLKVIGEP